MLVYGDRSRVAEPRAALRMLEGRLRRLPRLPPVDRHDALVTALIGAGELAQGLADAEFDATGVDDLSAIQEAAGALLLPLAQAVDRSWRGAGEPLDLTTELQALAAHNLPARVTLKQAEGFAFYAVYPEAYLEAARALASRPVVIGLRSIGTTLAGCVAAASGAERNFTVRPSGPPFDRRPRISESLAGALLAESAATFAIVDEGPGLSGSSFAGVADTLVEQGVARDRIVFFPSHPGEPGPEAGDDRLQRWRAARREVRNFEDLFLGADVPSPLERLFADVTGPLVAPLEDLSGGAWRAVVFGDLGDWPPVQASQERRKFRLDAEGGTFLVKFAGLGEIGPAKLARARALHTAGFTPEPLALRRGLLLERWHDERRPLGGRPKGLLERLAAYVRFRANRFRSPRAGASLADLHAMGEANTREALGDSAVEVWRRWSNDDLTRLKARSRPIHIDGRMHRWEWLDTPAGLIKTDALDHASAHDLIGPQDAAWDVAGAIVEWDLDAAEAAHLVASTKVDPELLALLTPCYLAFQLGAWTFAAAAAAADEGRSEMQRRLYMDRLARLLASGGAAS